MTRPWIPALVLSLALCGPAAAQEEATPIDTKALATTIATLSESFAQDIDTLGRTLSDLPAEMAATEQFYDDMIASVDRMLDKVDAESDVAADVLGLKDQAEAERVFWQERCDESGKNRDCEYVTRWDERVAEALLREEEYLTLVDEMEQIRETYVDNRVYAIADLKLGEFDRALTELKTSLETMGTLRTEMQKLAVAIGGPEFGQQETN
ncbi:hypothetical protein [Pseudoponticoccus marisrubri]|uniref:Uncharacterized protein n=1 Tax=Pseudoponticoccus marisrubri TaxID=1685382 RepID=A0A0W7WPM6_9RHOB|nr:hypothetical protein [Pseudoponticoccus marisrubri]KUF12452.1 hypothetical protein AVJ23_01600 [Pseudoponticoccus marisrubri]